MYLRALADGAKVSQIDFAAEHGASVHTFRAYLRSHGEGIASELGLEIKQRPRRTRVQLTDRDIAFLARLSHDRCHDLAFVAKHWFGAANDPKSSASRRLRLLEGAGYINIGYGEPPLVTLTDKGARRIGTPGSTRRMHPRHVKHHLATLRAIESYRNYVESLGGRFVQVPLSSGRLAEYKLEFHIQSEERHGRGTMRGRRYEISPDAVVFAELPSPITGELQAYRIALEYFTAAYSESQIRSKAVFAKTYDAVHQVADSRATAERVASLTHEPCVVQRSA